MTRRRGPLPNLARRKQIYDAWVRNHEELSLRAIGRMVGVSHGRVWQIVRAERERLGLIGPPEPAPCATR